MLWTLPGALDRCADLSNVPEQDGRVIDKVEGADAAAVTRMVQRHCAQSRDASSKAGSIAPPQAYSNGSALHSSAAPSGQSLEEKVKQLISREPIMLFMKAGSGTPCQSPESTTLCLSYSLACVLQHRLYTAFPGLQTLC